IYAARSKQSIDGWVLVAFRKIPILIRGAPFIRTQNSGKRYYNVLSAAREYRGQPAPYVSAFSLNRRCYQSFKIPL
ncbi:MAG: hypothetical protein WCB61_28785, partial [Pseudolabrys sp.]